MVDGKETGFWSIVELERVGGVVVVVVEVVLTVRIVCSAMSRCFPFPPPGYEKEARNGNADLLKKEKHKEKKHKKEKRDKEKRESKERKDKDRSKDKNKEKKDRKEKHKDKTKDKDKNRTPEDTKTEIRPEIRHEDQFGYNCKSDVQDSKFTEEFGRRIRDEERGAADRSVGNFTTTTQGRFNGVGVSTALEKESGNKMVPDFAGRVQKRHDNLLPVQKRTEEMGAGVATAKQRTASGENVSDFSSTEPGKNHVTGRQMGNFTGSFQSGTEGGVASNSLQKERSGSNNLANSLQEGKCAGNNITGREVNNFMGSGQRTEDMLTANPMQKERAGSNNVPGWPVDNFLCSTKKSGFTAKSMLKERGASNNLVSNSPTGAAQIKNDGMGQQSQNLSSSTQKSTGGVALTPKMEKERVKDSEISMHTERGASNNVVRNLVGAAERKNDRMGQQGGNPMPSIPRIAEGVGLAPKMEKQAVKDNGMVPYTIATEQKTNDWTGKSAEKPSEKMKEKKEKSKEKKTKEGKGEKHKDRDRHEKKKSKRKDKDRHKDKKKEEKIRDKSEHKHEEHDNKLEEIRTKDQVDDITKSKSPHAENAIFSAADPNNKKRKGIEINGFLLEIDERPNKLSKTTASSSRPIVENGRTLKLNHITSRSSLELDAINKTKAELVLVNKETKANGKAEAHPPSVVLRPSVAVVSGQNGNVSSRPNHPDAQYLRNVYSVPEMAEWPEYDDQEWLFLGKNPEPLKKLKDDAVLPEVWAKGLQIESADVFALPYVIPF